MRVTVVSWRPEWAVDFRVVRDELLEACANLAGVRVEHVGSTSVPLLAAKPVLDVAVIVEDVAPAIDALGHVGYAHQGERGIPGRHAFRAPRFGPPRHVYVTPVGSLALRNHLAVRDVLRLDADLRRRYNDLKLALATREFASADEYVAAKTPLLQEVLRASGQFSATELAEIAAMQPSSEA